MSHNYTLARTFVDQLMKHGVRYAVISPGSRSTPLTLAVAEQKEQLWTGIVYDERSAGFVALGIAKATRKPTLLVCTSGTAVANYFPAIIEAYQSEVPIVVASADRPYELQETGSNQTIDQYQIFGSYAKYFHEFCVPEGEEWKHFGKIVKSVASRVATAVHMSTNAPAGPVHFNFQFRKPLEPTSEEIWQATTMIEKLEPKNIRQGTVHPSSDQIDSFVSLISKSQKPMIVVGPNLPTEGFDKLLYMFADSIHAPVLSDVGSNVNGIWTHETFLQSKMIRKSLQPDLIIQFGKMPVSKWLGEFLEGTNAPRVFVSSSGRWQDDSHNTHEIFVADPHVFVEIALSRIKRSEGSNQWKTQWEKLENFTRQQIDQLIETEPMEATAVATFIRAVPKGSAVFLGNSLSLRHAAQFSDLGSLRTFVNRGTSGIDGNLSTALGISIGLNERVYAVVGDLTLIHDLNFLSSGLDGKLTILVINNHGGNIFSRLPIFNHHNFEKYFYTPHSLHFEAIANFYGMEYEKADPFTMKKELTYADGNVLVELQTNGMEDEMRRKNLIEGLVKIIENEFGE